MGTHKVVRYLGQGKAFLSGVPARDMTLDEWEALDEDLRKVALALGLYKIETVSSHEAKAQDESAEADGDD